MTGLAAHIAPKVARLVSLLASDHDGEALAAVRALQRVLDASGHDLHDIAALIEASSGPTASRDRAQRNDAPPSADMVKQLLASDRLTAWERRYCNDLARIIYRGEVLTPGQHAKLAEIYAQRIGGAQ